MHMEKPRDMEKKTESLKNQESADKSPHKGSLS